MTDEQVAAEIGEVELTEEEQDILERVDNEEKVETDDVFKLLEAISDTPAMILKERYMQIIEKN